MELILIGAASIFVTIAILWRASIYSAAFLYSTYLTLSIFALFVFAYNADINSRVFYIPRSMIHAGSAEAAYVYAFQVAICATSVFVRSPGKRTLKWSTDITHGVLGDIAIYAFVALLSLLTLWHALTIDWQKAIFTTSYLAMNDPVEMGIHSVVAGAFHGAMHIVLIATGPLLIYAATSRKYAACVILGAIFLYCFSYQVGSHSRIGGLALIVLGGAMIFMMRRNRLTAALPIALGALFYFGALVGRGSGEHGLSTIPRYFYLNEYRLISDYYIVSVYTLFEGVLVTAQASMISGDHPTIYKILSFSPLPGALDGFAAIRDSMQIRISVNVPIGSWSETLMFGPAYFAALSAIVLMLVLLNAYIVHVVAPRIAIAFSMATTFFLVFSNAYPLRNSLRYILVLAIAHALAIVWIMRRGSSEAGIGGAYETGGRQG